MSESSIEDFEDLLRLLHDHGVRYLIVGGLAFIYHAKPRYTKGMDLWIDPNSDNIARANEALREFGSPLLIEPGNTDEIVQLGVEPNRIDLLLDLGGASFSLAWMRRIQSHYGDAPASWIDLDTLIEIKSAIDHPRHQEDARVLRMVRERRRRLQER